MSLPFQIEPHKVLESEMNKLNDELQMALVEWKKRSAMKPQFKF